MQSMERRENELMEDTMLKASMADFFRARYKKLEKKEKQGYINWDNSSAENDFRCQVKIRAKLKLTQRNLVNIANYCNFLWQMIEDRKER